MSPSWRNQVPAVLAALLAVSALLSLEVATAPPAAAHPLGSFSVNSAHALTVAPDHIVVDVVVDLAEVPTVQALPAAADGSVQTTEAAALRQRTCQDVLAAAELALDGRRVPLSLTASDLRLPPGQAGLPTARIECALGAAATTTGAGLTFRSGFAEDRVGWRETTLAGAGVALVGASVPAISPSRALTDYPQDLLSSPLDQRTAAARVEQDTAGAGAPSRSEADPAAEPARGVDHLTAAYTRLVAAQDLTLVSGVAAALLAVLLGGLHAFAPGHGKALMAASLMVSEGSVRQAALIGLSVTATHTLGVLVLGTALAVTTLVAPERVYVWLGMASGLLLIAIGLGLLRAALRRHSTHPQAEVLTGSGAADHAHHHGHHHGHGPHAHGLFSHRHAQVSLSPRSLLAIGFTGGLVPSPSALLVLLGGIALGRAWFGVVLVLAYGLGMAVALVATGLALVRCRDWVETRSAQLAARGRAAALLAVGRALPAVTATVVVMAGAGVFARGAAGL